MYITPKEFDYVMIRLKAFIEAIEHNQLHGPPDVKRVFRLAKVLQDLQSFEKRWLNEDRLTINRELVYNMERINKNYLMYEPPVAVYTDI